MENELIRSLLKKAEPLKLNDTIHSLSDLYETERSHNELRKGIVSELEYLKKDIELSELFNYILTLEIIKLNREHGRQEDLKG